MKKILLYALALLNCGFIASCSDDDDSSTVSSGREFMTMFRMNDNHGKGDDDPYNCGVKDLNDVQLYWYAVDDAYGYRVKWALMQNVSGGTAAWEKADTTGLLIGDTVIVGADQVSLLVKDLNYQTNYRFAIQTLHSADLNDPLNSKWYGYGGGTEWADYYGAQTSARYDVPSIIQASDITKTSMRINLNRSISGYNADEMEGFNEYFTNDGTNFKVDYLTVKANYSSPTAVVPEKYVKYMLTDEDWERGYVDIEGLSESSVYNIDVWDADIPIEVDASYNPLMKRTKGDPGPAILIEHVATPTDTIGDNVFDISSYDAMEIDAIIKEYCSTNTLAENQTYYLEGGKTYFCGSNLSIYKGLTLETNPADLAAGKGMAKLYLSGMTQTGNATNTCNFMLGRQPETGENASIPLDIDTVRFRNLYIDVPLAMNNGHKDEKLGSASGNYFMNMYSNGMGINVNLLEWDGCTFNGIVRGFFRIQGSNDFTIHNINMKNCLFYNCGYYSSNGSGYSMIFADHGSKPKSNILENVHISGCTFYNSPFGNLVTDNNKNNNWDASIRWNVYIENNTFINFQTRSSASPIVNMRYMPGGSSLTIKNNLIIVTRDEADANRTLNCAGSDIRNIQGGDGTGVVTFDVANNWSTNNNLTAGQVFTKSAFSAKSNSIGKFISSCNYPSGTSELDVHVDNISATELMVAPNPKHFQGTTNSHLDHWTDDINCLYFQNTDAVKNSEIYKRGIGDPRWRSTVAAGAKAKKNNTLRYILR